MITRVRALLHDVADRGAAEGMDVGTVTARFGMRNLELRVADRSYSVQVREATQMGGGHIGLLETWIRGPALGAGVRIRDRRRKPLTADGIVQAIVDAQPSADLEDRRRAERQRERDKETAEHVRVATERAEIDRRRRVVREALSDWQTAQDLRVFAEQLREHPQEDRSSVETLIFWTLEYADWLDPMNRTVGPLSQE